jgi:hypothetical protein
MTRRAAHVGLLSSIFAATCPCPALGSLVQFPAAKLNSTYWLVRAGLSEAESQGFVLSNPVAKTSMTSGLCSLGKRQIIDTTLPMLLTSGACENGCWLWPGMATNSYQTAEILAEQFGLGRNRIVPEFSKLDSRGVGALEGGDLTVVRAEVAAGDAASADWRPPRGENGTPNESVLDVMTRGRELLSLLETQFQGQNVVIIAPDSDNLSILQAAVLGVDLREHGKYGFAPGEARILERSTLPWDDSPRTIPCPNPPKCR